MQRFVSMLVTATLAGLAAAQSPLVVPSAAVAADGNSSTGWPFDVAAARLIYSYDSSHFTTAGVTYPILISQIRYRANAATASWTGSSGTLQMDLSTTPFDYTLISTTWDNNHGVDRATVFNGPFTIPAGSSTAGVPGPFHHAVTFTTPFLYDPSLGDLTIDTIHSGLTIANTPTLDAVTTAGVANAKRVYSVANPPAATATLWSGDLANVLEFTFVPAAGLYPAFTATPLAGPTGTLVTFTNQTYTSDPGGVLLYQWDFENDGTFDSTAVSPTHTYATEGIYSVKLQATDALHGTQSIVRTAYITIGAVDASFTASVVSGTTVQFTDTSTGGPTTWAWDYEDDGIVDSTMQSPAHVYPVPGQYTCRLTVTDAISSDTTTQAIGVGIIPVPAFDSTFSSATLTRGFWFQSPTRFSIVSATVPNEFVPAETIQNVAIYRLPAVPPVFSATATGGLEFTGLNYSVASPIPCAVSFDVGELVGVLGACGTTTMRNSYGTPTGPFASSVLGVPTTLTRFGTQFNINTTGADHPYFQATGQVSRVILGVTPCAAIPYGAGSPSGLGPAAPTMRGTALPFVGQTAIHSVTQNDSFVLQLMVGGFGRVAFPVPPFGTVLIGSVALVEVMNGGAPVGPGTTTWSFNVPNNPSLVGASVNWQNAGIVIPTGEWHLSNGVEWWIDNP